MLLYDAKKVVEICVLEAFCPWHTFIDSCAQTHTQHEAVELGHLYQQQQQQQQTKSL